RRGGAGCGAWRGARADRGCLGGEGVGDGPKVAEVLDALTARPDLLAFQSTPSRYSRAVKEQLVARLARHYTTVHSLGRSDPTAAVDTLAARDHTDDVLVY